MSLVTCTIMTQTDDTSRSQDQDMYTSSDSEEDEDDDYMPAQHMSSDSESDHGADSLDVEQPCMENKPSVHKETKYIIFWTSLLQLISMCCCFECGSRALQTSTIEIGTMLIITFTCNDCGKRHQWHSQSYIGNLPAGNILLSAATLFAGATIGKVLRVLSHLGVKAITARTFFRHQSNVLQSTIRRVWMERQQWMFATHQAEGEDLVCGGDGRADSPGHSAKFGTYTLIDLNNKAVLDVQLVQVC